MSRRAKQTVEYFPHFVAGGKTIRILSRYWGNTGYAFWFKLLELLCSDDGQCLDLSGAAEWEDFLAYMLVDEQVAYDILDKLAELEKIDPDLWQEKRWIWCDALIENLRPVYSKRTGPAPEKPSLDGFSEQESEVSGISGIEKPQSKVEYSRVKERKEENIPPISPNGDIPPKGGPPAPPARKKKPEKQAYGEFGQVRLTEEEYTKLVQQLGKDEATALIEDLDGYVTSTGKKYKSHYATLLNWWRKDRSRGTGKPAQGSSSFDANELQDRILRDFMRDGDPEGTP